MGTACYVWIGLYYVPHRLCRVLSRQYHCSARTDLLRESPSSGAWRLTLKVRAEGPFETSGAIYRTHGVLSSEVMHVQQRICEKSKISQKVFLFKESDNSIRSPYGPHVLPKFSQLHQIRHSHTISPRIITKSRSNLIIIPEIIFIVSK